MSGNYNFRLVQLDESDKYNASLWPFKVYTPLGTYVRSLSALDAAFRETGVPTDLPRFPSLYDGWVGALVGEPVVTIESLFLSPDWVAFKSSEKGFVCKPIGNKLENTYANVIHAMYAKSPEYRKVLLQAKEDGFMDTPEFRRLIRIYIAGHCAGGWVDPNAVAGRLFKEPCLAGLHPEAVFLHKIMDTSLSRKIVQWIRGIEFAMAASLPIDWNCLLNGAGHISSMRVSAPCPVYSIDPCGEDYVTSERVYNLMTGPVSSYQRLTA